MVADRVVFRQRAEALESQLEQLRFTSRQDREQQEIRISALAAELELAQAAVVKVRLSRGLGGCWRLLVPCWRPVKLRLKPLGPAEGRRQALAASPGQLACTLARCIESSPHVSTARCFAVQAEHLEQQLATAVETSRQVCHWHSAQPLPCLLPCSPEQHVPLCCFPKPACVLVTPPGLFGSLAPLRPARPLLTWGPVLPPAAVAAARI